MSMMFGCSIRVFEERFRNFQATFSVKRSELTHRYKEVLEIDPIEDEKHRGFDSFEKSFEAHSGPFSETPSFILRYVKFVCQYSEPEIIEMSLTDTEQICGETLTQKRDRLFWEAHQKSDEPLPKIGKRIRDEIEPDRQNPYSESLVRSGAKKHHEDHYPDVPFKERPKGRKYEQ